MSSQSVVHNDALVMINKWLIDWLKGLIKTSIYLLFRDTQLEVSEPSQT